MIKKTLKITKKTMIRKIINIIFEYFLITLGFILIVIYFHVIFIRERLPRDIPFDLTEFRFYVLCIICCSFTYLIYRNLYPKPINFLFFKSLTIINKPIKYCVQYFRNLNIISQVYDSIWINLVRKLDILTWSDNILLIYFFTIIPRLLLISIFVVDVFYVKKIEIFYYFIFFGILPLLYLIFIKYLEKILEQYLQMLEYAYNFVTLYDEKFNYPDYEENSKAIYHGEIVTIRKYLNILYDLFLEDDSDIEYEASPSSKQWHIDRYKNLHKKTIEEFTHEDFKYLEKEFHFVMPKLLIIKIFLDYMTNKGQKSAYIPEIKLLILIMYLICWLYILFVSIHTLHDLNFTLKILEILTPYSKIPDYFSE